MSMRAAINSSSSSIRKVVYRLVAKYSLQHLVKAHQGAPPLRGNDAWRQLADV